MGTTRSDSAGRRSYHSQVGRGVEATKKKKQGATCCALKPRKKKTSSRSRKRKSRYISQVVVFFLTPGFIFLYGVNSF